RLAALTRPGPLRRVAARQAGVSRLWSTPYARLRTDPSNLIWFTPAKGACMRNAPALLGSRSVCRFPMSRSRIMRRCIFFAAAIAVGASALAARALAQERIPVLVPITGALALEGQSQRDGALLAFEDLARRSPPQRFEHPVFDTASNPQTAVQ